MTQEVIQKTGMCIDIDVYDISMNFPTIHLNLLSSFMASSVDYVYS